MNNDKYRFFVKTKQGNFLVASTPSVNGLIKIIGDWLDGPIGKYVMDEELVSVELMVLDDNGNVVSTEQLPVEKRTHIAAKAELMGAR